MPSQTHSPFSSRFRLSTVNSQLFPPNSCRFTLLSKNASANHLESHSCKNTGLKVPCFHTLTKKGRGEGVPPRAAHHEPLAQAQRTFDLPSAARIESARTSGFARIGRPKRS